MIKAEVIEKFDLKDFSKLKNLVRKDKSKNKEGSLYIGDTFECDEQMADYLSGNNPIKTAVIKIVEVEPKKVKEETKVICEDEEVEKLFEEKPTYKKSKKKGNK